MLNWIVWNRIIFIITDLALDNLQRLICHKTQLTNQPTEKMQLVCGKNKFALEKKK